MNSTQRLIVCALFSWPFALIPSENSDKTPTDQKLQHMSAEAPAEAGESAGRAERRYEEMLGRMQASIEEIAQLYGNPTFLQVFTNDGERAAELKQRLRAARSGDEILRELSDLQKKRDDLLNDIALKTRESSRLANRLVRQRTALDAVASALEEARKAVEDTSK